MAQPKPEIPHHMSPLTAYEARVAAGDLQGDNAQRAVARALDALHGRLIAHFDSPRPTLIGRLFSKPQPQHKALYLYGEVGRGKTMLMDMFFACLPAEWSKQRIHFHAFMRDVHARLHAWRKIRNDNDDLLPRVVLDIANDTQLLCLDEFQVTDVTDAMILSRLFTLLMEQGVAVVITSNRHPRDLYQGGLQREQFLTFVDLVEARMDIVSLESPTDYRLKQLVAMQSTYVFPINESSDLFLLESWDTLTHHGENEELSLDVDGRVLRVFKHTHGCAWLTFDELCVRPLGAHDYIELARVCHTIFLQGIPRMTPEDRNEARRFVTLIDVLYEHKVKLICTANAPVDGLYPSGDGTFEFQRTVSRLVEMQSASYLALPHIG